MKLLLAAPFHAPRFEGVQIAAAARRLGTEVVEFAHPASRDPTLELPEAVRAARPDAVLLVAPEREDPGTLDLVRRFGAVVLVWDAPLPAGAPSHLRARRAWIANAADAVFATTAGLAAARRDRHGRPARRAPAGFDQETLSSGEGGGTAAARSDFAVAVRAADDPLFLEPDTGGIEFRGFGEKAAFPGLGFGGPLSAPKEFSELVRGRRYIAGGRIGGLPAVFDDVAAAFACGARVVDVGVKRRIADGTERFAGDAGHGGFAVALESILAAACDVRMEGGGG